MSNFLYAIMQAVSNSVASGSNQQLTDAESTTMSVGIQEHMVEYWSKQVNDKANSVTNWANKLANSPNNKTYQANLTGAQTSYENMNTIYNKFKEQAGSGVQAMQTQAGQDASTVQQRVQVISAVNQIANTISAALAQRLN